MQRRKFLIGSIISGTSLAISPSLMFGRDKIAGSPEVLFRAVQVDVRAAGTVFKHFWSKCVGAGRANEGLRASWLEQLKLAKQRCGFEYCRFHGLFHDDMFVFKEVNGKAIYNWQYVDDLFDRLLDIGVKPFVELGFVPKVLASTPNTTFWWKGNTAPPNDYAKWGNLVSSFTRHCIDRYGILEVRSWYFEVWNEPDLHGFWDGTKSQYFELYKTSVNAIKSVDNRLKVGGPATSNFVPDERFDGELEDKTKHKTLTVPDINALEWRGVWIKDFINYCAKENLPVDFISTHPYPTDWALDPETKKGAGRVRKVNATREDLEWLQKTIKSSAYPHAELHCSEWSSSPSSRDPTHDSLQAAAYIIKANIDGIGLTDSLSYWTFTDVFEEAGAGDTIFHGGFGMINYQGIVKPTFHAYSMLNQLGNELLHREEGMIITRHANTKKITILLYHFPEERKNVVDGNVQQVLDMGSPKKFALDLAGLRSLGTMEIQTLDRNHGFAFAKWKDMGSPEPPTREQTSQLKAVAMALNKEMVKTNALGQFRWERTLKPWDCVLIQSV